MFLQNGRMPERGAFAGAPFYFVFIK